MDCPAGAGESKVAGTGDVAGGAVGAEARGGSVPKPAGVGSVVVDENVFGFDDLNESPGLCSLSPFSPMSGGFPAVIVWNAEPIN